MNRNIETIHWSLDMSDPPAAELPGIRMPSWEASEAARLICGEMDARRRGCMSNNMTMLEYVMHQCQFAIDAYNRRLPQVQQHRT